MSDASSELRLPPPWGNRIDRTRKIEFIFNGRPWRGYAGDTVASALMANGVRTLSRSFKFHRPRGVLTLCGQDGNTLVQIGSEPNVRADTRLIESGLEVKAQNVLGSLRLDAARILDRMGGFLPVGFYYHAFYKPKGAWRRWEPLIREMAGLGRLDVKSRHRIADSIHAYTDIAVIGAGPAGLEAALAAADAGAQVALIDRNPSLGGSMNYRRDADPAEAVARAEAHRGIRMFLNTVCTGWFDDNLLTLITSDRLVKLRSRAVILATGELEQPAVFRNNDLPGIMLGAAAQRLMRLYGVRPGRRAVVFAADDRGYEVACDLRDAGVEVVAVVDPRPGPADNPPAAQTRQLGITVLWKHGIRMAKPDRRGCVKSVVVARLDTDGRLAGSGRTIDCDALCVSAGRMPAAQLACHSGARLQYDPALQTLSLRQPDELKDGFVTGAVNGVKTMAQALQDGHRAGLEAAAATGHGSGIQNPPALQVGCVALGPTIFPHPDGRDFVDFDEDLQVQDIECAVARGYDDLELLKRYSTVVMGPSQGKQSALNNLRVASVAAGRSIDQQSLTTQRPPFHPEPIRLLAGRAMDPVRRTSIHQRHMERGAHMSPAGSWMRPAWYGPPEREQQAIDGEVHAVRHNVGVIDVSTLGKLELRGPDAAEFMNRMYTSAFKQQPVGRTRYALMTDQSGAIIDDGVACRVGTDIFYVTSTTTGVAAVHRSMLRWNAQWRLAVTIKNVTSAFAAINLAGPHARDVLNRVGTDMDLSAEGFPYLAYREGRVASIPARVLRVGFVGELGYEIHVPAQYGETLWDAVMDAGAAWSIAPFGVEAQRMLRLEKGHIIVGQDTDGLTTPHHAGMKWAIAGKKPFFVGKRAIEVIGRRGLDRGLVGFRMDESDIMPEECNLVIRERAVVGRVTSVARSRTCGAILGLAYAAPDQLKPGCVIQVKLSDGSSRPAQVVPTPFYDPDNLQQKS